MSTQKESILNQFANLFSIGEIHSAARIYFDWAYNYKSDFNRIMESDSEKRLRVKYRVLGMSGDHTDQP